MPLYEQDFASIRTFVERIISDVVGRRTDYFVTGAVIKRDVEKKCVYLSEFGDQPIPVVGFSYTAKYYDTDNLGVVRPKTAEITPVVPAVGEIVFVARERGSEELPRCLGVIQGRDWFVSED